MFRIKNPNEGCTFVQYGDEWYKVLTSNVVTLVPPTATVEKDGDMAVIKVTDHRGTTEAYVSSVKYDIAVEGEKLIFR